MCLMRMGVALRGAVDDTMLLSYALNPTHATQALADVAARHGQPAPSRCRRPPPPFMRSFRRCAKRRKTGVERVYREIDLPLAPVLYPHGAGRRPHRHGCARADFRSKFSGEIERVGERIFELAGQRFNINSPKQLGVVLFTHLGLPAPASRGKGKAVSTAQDVLEFLAEKHEVPRLVLEYRHLVQAQIELHRRVAAAGRLRLARAHHLSGRGHGHRPALLRQSESAEHSHPHRTGPRDSRRLHRRTRHAIAVGRLLADRAAAAGALQRRSAADARLRRRTSTFIRLRPAKFSACRSKPWTRRRAAAPRR